MRVADIAANIKTKNVLITGGEPLCQRIHLFKLIDALKGKNIQIETNGSLPIIIPNKLFKTPIKHQGSTASKATWIVDYKMESSGMKRMMGSYESFCNKFKHIFAKNDIFPIHSIIKCVVANESEIKTGIELIDYIQTNYGKLNLPISYAFSPIDGNPKLVNEIISTSMINNKIWDLFNDGKVNISIQIHKLAGMN